MKFIEFDRILIVKNQIESIQLNGDGTYMGPNEERIYRVDINLKSSNSIVLYLTKSTFKELCAELKADV